MIPVAPLYLVKRSDDEARSIFESDPLEARDVLPHYSTLYVAAREYTYKPADFKKVDRALRDILPNEWSPHLLWHIALVRKPEGTSHTFFEHAIEEYEALILSLRGNRRRR